MSQTTFSFPLTGGLNRSVASFKADPAGFWVMQNFRQSRTSRGLVETTPSLKIDTTFGGGTIYEVGVGVRTGTGPVYGTCHIGETVRLAVTKEAVFDNTVAFSSGQVQVYDQVVTTTTTSAINSGCYLTINNNSVAGLNVLLGNSVDIEIDGATTFKWRVNGGAYTTLVPITTTGVSISGGNATVWFLIATGFTVGDKWQWFRYDSISQTPGSNCTGKQVEFLQYNDSVYFVAPYGERVYRYTRPNVTAAFQYVISVGYRPLYARHLAIFGNHLIVSGGVDTALSTFSTWRQWSCGIAWSDRGNFDNFIATDINEADVYIFPNGASVTAGIYTPQVLGFFIERNQLFAIHKDGIFATAYYGLPVVFNFEFFNGFDTYPLDVVNFPNRLTVIPADTAVYLYRTDGLWRFSGGTLTNVGLPLGGLASTAPIAYTYLAQYGELHILCGTTLYVYQERYDAWYTRSMSLASAVASFGVDWTGTVLYTGAASLKLYTDDSGAATPIKDFDSGNSYTVPTLTFQLFSGGKLYMEKELDGCYVGASFVTGSGSYETPYIQVSYNTVETGIPSASGFSNDTNATVIATAVNGHVSQPRVSFRAIQLRLLVKNDTSTKAPASVTVTGFDVRYYNPELAAIEQ